MFQTRKDKHLLKIIPRIEASRSESPVKEYKFPGAGQQIRQHVHDPQEDEQNEAGRPQTGATAYHGHSIQAHGDPWLPLPCAEHPGRRVLEQSSQKLRDAELSPLPDAAHADLPQEGLTRGPVPRLLHAT